MVKIRERSGSHNRIGALGEVVTTNWLKNHYFSILFENYQKPWGEIDVIAKQGEVIHFVEVKTVSYETKGLLDKAIRTDSWRPEEQVHHRKINKIQRTIETWLIENTFEGEWQFDIAAVRLVPREKYATINWLWNVVE